MTSLLHRMRDPIEWEIVGRFFASNLPPPSQSEMSKFCQRYDIANHEQYAKAVEEADAALKAQGTADL